MAATEWSLSSWSNLLLDNPKPVWRKAPQGSHKRFTQTAIWATLERFWVQNPKYKRGTRGTQISLNSYLKTCLGFPSYTGRSRSETLILNGLGLSWKICRKNILPEIWSINPNLQSIELGRNALSILHQLESNFT